MKDKRRNRLRFSTAGLNIMKHCTLVSGLKIKEGVIRAQHENQINL